MHSEETKAKISKSHKGRKFTAQHKAALSKAIKAAWAAEGLKSKKPKWQRNPHAVALGRKGGRAYVANSTHDERVARGKHGVVIREQNRQAKFVRERRPVLQKVLDKFRQQQKPVDR